MTDTLSVAARSKRMGLVRYRGTRPEKLVCRLIRNIGCKCEFHVPTLPGKPDFSFPALKKIVFVHGCFWHRHPNCSLARLPKSRLSFWLPKLTGNRSRDLRNISRLRRQGWSVKVIWECRLKKVGSVEKSLRRFLEIKNA
jgi:DNA mismatch endonuclease (patch repair protein)